MTEATTLRRKAEFYWASIGGADPEPVELVVIDGRRAVYTCGCGDPFFLDDKTVRVKLGTSSASICGGSPTWVFDDLGAARPMQRPGRMATAEKRAQKEAYHTRVPVVHSWRGPR